MLKIVLGISLQLGPRDSIYGLHAVYFASPWPIIWFESACATLMISPRFRPMAWRALGLFALLLLSVEFRFWPQRSAQPNDGSVRVLLWNVGRFVGGREAVLDAVRGYDADVIVLIEAVNSADRATSIRAKFPEYRLLDLPQELFVLVRGKADGRTYLQASPWSYLERWSVESRGSSFDVMAVDVCGNPKVDRRESLTNIARAAFEAGDRPLIIAGDFNTPPGSFGFDLLKTRLKNAFLARGRGYGPTWPAPAPVLQLDQIWVSRHVHVLSCEPLWTTLSDHRPLLATIRVRPTSHDVDGASVAVPSAPGR